LEELLDCLVRVGRIRDKQPLLDQLIAREQIVSTGFENGFALPHVKTSEVQRIVCAVGLHAEGIDFDAIDGNPSRIFVLELAPEDATGPHLQFMASVSHRINLIRPNLLTPGLSAEAIHHLLTQTTGVSP
jgi:mannitol/fructose-specific phosphotransferase system IIA component (Ntr-type)